MHYRPLLLSVAALLITGCVPSPSPGAADTPTPTATPTPTVTVTVTPTSTSEPVVQPDEGATPTTVPEATATSTPTPTASRCQDLSGSVEIQILVGPSEAVGLEPQAVGSLPWQVVTDAPPYLVAGDTTISYQDTLVEEWGSFDVQMNMGFAVEGTCDDAGEGTLDMAVAMDGEQLVTVTSEGFSAQYPWAGSETRTVTFPLEEGATVSGEGWAFVLHLN